MKLIDTGYNNIKILLTKNKKGENEFFVMEFDKIVRITQEIDRITVEAIETKKKRI